MIARIVDNKYIYLEQISAQEEDILDKAFSVRHPSAQYLDLGDTFFDGVYHKYNKFHHRMARPFLHELERVANNLGMPLNIIDDRPPPKYPPPDESKVTPDLLAGVTLDDHQVEAIKAVCREEVGIFSCPTGGGKCFGFGTLIRMFDGSIKPVQDIRAGDLLMGDDSTPRFVKSTTSGFGKLYKINQKNGNNYVVNDCHTLVLKRTNDGTSKAGCTCEIDVSDYLGKSKTFKHIHKGFKSPIEYPFNKCPLDPYFLGLWLGDGRHDQPSITVNRDDTELFEYLEDAACCLGMVATRKEDPRENADQVAIVLYEGISALEDYIPFMRNPITRALHDLGVFRNKHVPDCYKFNSTEVRRELLAGFIDAYGHSKRGLSADIIHKRGQLIDGIVDVARSLGLRVSESDTIKGCKETGYDATYKRITISGDLSNIPTKLYRKRFAKPKSKRDPLVCGISVEDYGYGNYYGFELDGSKRFLLADCTVVHNTEMMAGIAKIMDCPTVILSEMTVVVDQIKHRLELREVASEVGMFYAGKRPNGQQIIVGSFQSLIIPKSPKKTENDTPESYARKMQAYKTRRKNSRKLRDIIKKCDLLLVDEADNATGKQWRNLFWHWFRGRRKFGFTGTPFDPQKPVRNMVLKENLGTIIHKTSRKTLEKIGRIIPVTYTALAFGDESLIKDKSAFDIATREHMIENKQFHSLIKAVANKSLSSDPEHGVLILVESVPLGYKLEKIIDNARFICGDHSMKERKKVVEAFENRETRVLIGGKIVKRGLDLKGGCETLIVATGGKLASDFNQKVGRAVRRNKIGRAQIYDFFFLCNHYLYGHSRNRLKTIVAMGYPSKVIFKHGVLDAEKFIKSRFRRPKPK